MELKETFVSRQEIFHGRIVDLRVDTVRLPWRAWSRLLPPHAK